MSPSRPPHSLSDIRQSFLDFFGNQAHRVLPSSSLVPQNDPTLMFANAGMNQFKNIFTGAEKTDIPRAATSQKCVRAGGKHNDLDNVGYTARHHTFFEMLGNFSFGDYFKERAIELAWELLTKTWQIPQEKLCVTVYHTDDEAYNIWKRIIGPSDHRIIRIPTNDNFWSMGDTGPCGPCSEIFYDHGEGIFGGPPGSQDADGDRFVEIWNLVFMQYEKHADGSQTNLPKPSIDTGMGLERITAVMQGVHDNYDIDLFRDLIASMKQEIGRTTLGEPAAYKVIADHLRSSCFLIADGVMPSNEGRGYVLRRIMRRAMRYVHQLQVHEPLMHRLVPHLVRLMGEHYPELTRAQASISETLKTEEERFRQLLDRGMKLLDEETHSLQSGAQLSGAVAFKLYDTFGFPLDLTQDILRNRQISVDEAGFEQHMQQQRDMARAAWNGSGDTNVGKQWFAIKERVGATEFVGYDADEAEATLLAILKNGQEVTNASAGDDVFLVFNRTPFYGESGGQAGDTGHILVGEHVVANVTDTQKPLDGFHVHSATLTAAVEIGKSFRLRIDFAKRNATRANHSATHLLHKALRDALGEHVTQKGSLVDAQRLRFDFSHPKGVTAQEVAAIERTVNTVIARATPVDCQEMAPEDAVKAGAMALFGEKYGDVVRVLSIGKTESASPYSIELCGGTHVRNTGDIGLFKIISEGSVASGVRRIEAVTGDQVRDYFALTLNAQNAESAKLHEEHVRLHEELRLARQKLGQESKDSPLNDFQIDVESLRRADAATIHAAFAQAMTAIKDYLQTLQDENKKLGKALAEAKKQAALSASSAVVAETLGDIAFIHNVFDDLDPKELRGIAEQYIKDAEIALVASVQDGKASVVIAVNKSISGKFSAVTLVQAAVSALGGKGGGGKPEMAQGGGPDAAQLPAALDAVRAILRG